MSLPLQFEREENSILEAEERGEITHAEAMRELRDLRRSYIEEACQSAREAYEREMERW